MVSFISNAGEFYLDQIETKVGVNETKEVPSTMLYEMAAEIRRLNKIALDKETEVNTLTVELNSIKDKNYNDTLKLHAAIGKLNMANQIREAAVSYNKLDTYKGQR